MPRSRASAATLALHETPASAAQSGLRLERAGGDAAEDDAVAARLEGSALATEALGLQWHTWSRRSWWDPGWQDSLALGHNAPAIAGFGVQRAAVMPSASPWLAWFGPWNLEFFVGALEGVETPRRPFLVGSRLSLRPFDGLEIGLTRTAQWGGRGWPQSAGSFLGYRRGRGRRPALASARPLRARGLVGRPPLALIRRTARERLPHADRPGRRRALRLPQPHLPWPIRARRALARRLVQARLAPPEPVRARCADRHAHAPALRRAGRARQRLRRASRAHASRSSTTTPGPRAAGCSARTRSRGGRKASARPASAEQAPRRR